MCFGLTSYEYDQFNGNYFEPLHLDVEFVSGDGDVKIERIFNADTGGDVCLLPTLFEEVHSSVVLDIRAGIWVA